MSKIGIIGAMDKEVDTLQNRMTEKNISVCAGMQFHEGLLNGTEAVVVRCGIGKVNAALCVQILADRFHATHIINTGVAGSLNTKLNIGDILISHDVIHHDVNVTTLGYALGEVPGLGIIAFPADQTMGQLAMQLCAEVNPDIQARLGRVVSGDQFISSQETKDRLIAQFHGDCAEMEGASIAQGAWLNGLPFLIIRAISDKADGSAIQDYPTFEGKAAVHSARLVEALTAAL